MEVPSSPRMILLNVRDFSFTMDLKAIEKTDMIAVFQDPLRQFSHVNIQCKIWTSRITSKEKHSYRTKVVFHALITHRI